jgi:abhydrolase domain-containing protein 12
MRENQSNTKAKEPEGQRPANFSLYHRISNAKCARMVIVQDSATQTDLSVLGKKANYSAMLKSLVVKAFLGYFILCVLLICSSFFQSLFVYLNVIRWPLTNSELTDLNALGIPNARNIVLQTQDGYKIRGYHLIPISRLNANISFDDSYFDTHLATAKRIVIYFHGNGLTRGLHRRISIIKQISNFLDADVITFDYRGFGDSEGWPSENGINEDSLAIFKWIDRIISENRQEKTVLLTSTERVPSVPKLYFYGQSLGTGVATAAVSKLNSNLQKLSNIGVNGLILDSPFTTLLDAARTHPVASVFRLFPFVEGLM